VAECSSEALGRSVALAVEKGPIYRREDYHARLSPQSHQGCPHEEHHYPLREEGRGEGEEEEKRGEGKRKERTERKKKERKKKRKMK